MPKIQKFGIKFPIQNTDSESFLDLNEGLVEDKESQLIHLILTRKGSKIRDPEFGTNLLDYIFDANDEMSKESIKNTIKDGVNKYISGIDFIDFDVFIEENDENRKVVSIDYSVNLGNTKKINNIKVRI